MDNNKIVLPVLITKNFVVFPKNSGDDRIDAGREFSVNAINESRDNANSLLLIVTQKDENVEVPTTNDIFEYGTLCRIVSYTDMKGYLRIRVKGSARCKIDELAFDPKGFFSATFETLEDEYGDQKLTQSLYKKCVSSLSKLNDRIPFSSSDFSRNRGEEVDPSAFCDRIANYINLNVNEKIDILKANNVNERLNLINTFLLRMKAEKEVDQKIEQQVSKSLEKNQKEFILREKMKAIRNELGEGDSTENAPEDILKKLEDNPYPENVKSKIKSELKRYEMMPQASLEASLSMSYIQTLLSLPWFEKSEDIDDINFAKKVLDEDHYGLTKVKERIIEYLAVKKMTGNLKAPILCLYGPPGCGKTSLGKSIARALGRKFFKASLGGVSDESEIRGHRRTYVGSLPGRIIHGMKKCGTINPVFLLDEIDKLSTSYKGDPASALLEVLDPAQNFAFNANYVEEPYDLSNVLFICTANNLENIPGPLRDRLELINVPSYTEFEKLQIAKNFLFPKQLKTNGLTKKDVAINDDAFLLLIRKYTLEAGVRSLERVIASLIRKIIVERLSNNTTKKVNVTPKVAEKYLGKYYYPNDGKKEENKQIGVVSGLAYTEYGGDLLPIEVTHFPGKGELVLTGKLGDVMKESATIALDYVRANADKYKIDSKKFAETAIHIHFPEGAVPKDGPSAGVAITIAIISSLTNRLVDNNVAMTGEVTLRGKALPIGGLREKSLAALRNGVTTIIVPKDNERDVSELPDEVKNNMNIIFMTCVDDAVKVILE